MANSSCWEEEDHTMQKLEVQNGNSALTASTPM